MDQKALDISVQPTQWGEAEAGYLALASQQATLDDMREQVRNGASLFNVFHGSDHVGTYLLRVDDAPSGADGVVVAAGGRLPGFDFTFDLLPLVEKQFFGVKRIRIHTARGGMVHKLKASGYKLAEAVFTKDV